MQCKIKTYTRVIYTAVILFMLAAGISSCNKLIEIPEPINTITTNETFNTVAKANSAVVAIYSDMSFAQNGMQYASGSTTIYAGMSADELSQFGNGSDPFYSNNLFSNDGTVSGQFWTPAYHHIYMANAVLEGVNASTALQNNVKAQFTGEAKFLRAFAYFYLVNLFGDVPLVNSTAWGHTSLLPRSAAAQVYQQIMDDLKDAQSLLATDYSISGGERIRANVGAATALLARVYLYNRRWADAEAQATAVINNAGTYSLSTDLNDVFLKNSKEAILQFQNVNQSNFKYATQEGNTFIPPDATSDANYILTPELLNAFESKDARRQAWLDSVFASSGAFVYYPHKYKIRQTTPDNITEHYMVLRLAELYLIRAEVRAQQNKLAAAIGDLNLIRQRAGLPAFANNLSQEKVLEAIAKERRIELFAEWGHRWLDLKRTSKADEVLPLSKPLWSAKSKLFPIPQQEIITDPNLTQNEGY